MLAQMGLAAFAWQFGEKKGQGREFAPFPGGARGLIILAFIYVGCEILCLRWWARKSGRPCTSLLRHRMHKKSKCCRDSLPSTFDIPARTESLVPCTPTRSMKGPRNFFGIDTADAGSKDDIVTAELRFR